MGEQKWFQQALLQQEVLEVNVRIGIIPSTDHGQWLVEIKDPTDDRLIDMRSCPHFHPNRRPEVLSEIRGIVLALLDEAIDPF